MMLEAMDIVVTATRRASPLSSVPVAIVREELGDLKLYRLNERVTVAARAQKQVAMIAQADVPVERIYIFAFGLGSACVGLASALIMPLIPVTPTIGSYFVLTAFVVVVLGGMRSLTGAFVGAMIIGIVDSLSGYYIAPDLKEVVYFAIFIAILVFKPTGLFGLGRGTE